MRLYQFGMYIFIMLFGLEVFLFAPTVTNIADKESPLNIQDQTDAVYTLTDLHSSGRPNGVGPKEWEVWADEATKLKSSVEMDIRRVRTKFYGEDNLEFFAVGQKGRVNEKDLNLTIEGNVVTRSSNGYTFKTPIMMYASEQRELVTSSPVIMLGPNSGQDFRLDGVGMRADLRTGLIRVLENVKARKIVDTNGKEMKIESVAAEFSGLNKQTKFIDNVIMDVESVRVTGNTAVFQYDKQSQKVESVLVRGNVRVSDMDKWATSQEVSYDLSENKFVFKGSPRLVQKTDELFGDEIVFLDGGKTVKVFKARAKVDKNTVEMKQ